MRRHEAARTSRGFDRYRTSLKSGAPGAPHDACLVTPSPRARGGADAGCGLCWQAMGVMGMLILLGVAAALVCVLAAGALIYALRHPPRKTYAVALGRGNPTEPEAVGLEGEAMTLRLADGSTSDAWRVRGRRAEGPTVIVVHGFGDSRYGALTWAPLLAEFAAQVVLFDQRGQGESTAKAASLGEREAADVLAVMAQVLEHENATAAAHGRAEAKPRVVLFGYSMGASSAIAAAARAAEMKRTAGSESETGGRIAGVIADGPYRYWYEPVRTTLQQRRYPSEPMLTLARAALWLASAEARRFDRVEDARRLTCPLLVLHGSGDIYCPLNSARAIAAAAPQGELVVFEEGGHLDLAAREPKRYRDALARFFTRLDHENEPRINIDSSG